MIVVSDTGPLIALAKVNCLSLLKHLFGQIYIPLARRPPANLPTCKLAYLHASQTSGTSGL
jgi:hypothetical protein